jgi:hypothetical protein
MLLTTPVQSQLKMGQRGTRLTNSERDKLRASGKDVIPPSRAQNKLKFSGMNTTNPENFVFEDYALQLASQADWNRYANTPADRIFAGTQVTKVVVATPHSKLKKYKAHFLHSQTYTYHYQFCSYVSKFNLFPSKIRHLSGPVPFLGSPPTWVPRRAPRT